MVYASPFERCQEIGERLDAQVFASSLKDKQGA